MDQRYKNIPGIISEEVLTPSWSSSGSGCEILFLRVTVQRSDGTELTTVVTPLVVKRSPSQESCFWDSTFLIWLVFYNSYRLTHKSWTGHQLQKIRDTPYDFFSFIWSLPISRGKVSRRPLLPSLQVSEPSNTGVVGTSSESVDLDVMRTSRSRDPQTVKLPFSTRDTGYTS